MTTPPPEPVPCQRWIEKRPRYRPSGEQIRPSEYGVDGIVSDKTAREFIQKHHYSHSMNAARFKVGLYRRGPIGHRLVGVAVFSEPVQRASLSHWCGITDRAQGIELGRFVLLDEIPGMGETWFLARAFKLLRQHKPEIRAILSYSDPLRRVDASGRVTTPGHVGIIYQAHNGRYLGRASRRNLWVDRDQRTIQDRTLQKIRDQEPGCVSAERDLITLGAEPRRFGEDPRVWLDRVLVPPAFFRLKHPGNHTYAWALDPKLVLPHALQPYPRKSVDPEVRHSPPDVLHPRLRGATSPP